MQWRHGQNERKDFLVEANNFHRSIKFTSKVWNEKHLFLDTVTQLGNNRSVIDVYTKPTDTHQYLLPSSCHPKHCSKNIPYSQALRIRKICSNENTFNERTMELSKHLQTRGYRNEPVSLAISKARDIPREDLLKYKFKTETKDRIPFVITYHPKLPNIRNTIDKQWHIIDKSKNLTKMFPEKPVIAYKRPKSLKDILVRSKLTTNKENNVVGQSGPCNTKWCLTCSLMKSTCTFSSSSGAKSTIKYSSNCRTSNAIYLITCRICNKKYVGETKQMLARRMNLHRSDWKTLKFNRSPVAEHFHQTGHTFTDIDLCCIEFREGWSDKTRKERETYWIRRLHTLHPTGINKGD